MGVFLTDSVITITSHHTHSPLIHTVHLLGKSLLLCVTTRMEFDRNVAIYGMEQETIRKQDILRVQGKKMFLTQLHCKSNSVHI